MKEGKMREVTAIRRIDHDEAMRITAVENDAFADLLGALGPDDWSRPTACPLWDVRALASHVVGSSAAQASAREFARQVLRGRRLRTEIGAAFWWDGMNEVQVCERAGLTLDQLRAEWAEGSARALRARTSLPRAVARLPLLNLPAPIGRQPLAYLFDIGFTRDVWMHRTDIAAATGRAAHVSPEHDGRIVEDVVAEWATTHGDPFELELTGPAGGRFCAGVGGEQVRMDAVEFARLLAGRGAGTGVLRHPLPL